MKKERKRKIFVAALLLVAFVLWTVLVSLADVRQIGPHGSRVGLSTVNGWIHRAVGVNMALYTVTDWLGLVPVFVMLGVAVLGLLQWIKRKNILRVDFDILLLGAFYIVVFGFYVLFEYLVINYRPVLIDGYLEASYPSSTTMLVACVMPTAAMQLDARIKNRAVKSCAVTLCYAFAVFMIIGRFIAGVHWISDIIGGLLLSASLVTAYHSLAKIKL